MVLPLFGPNSFRDVIEIPVDYEFSVYPYIHPHRYRYYLYGLSLIDKRAQVLKLQSLLEEATLDKYVFARSAYMQRRAHQVTENRQQNFIYPSSQGQEEPTSQFEANFVS